VRRRCPSADAREARPPQEVYDDLKIPEDVISGVYANTCHGGPHALEFGIDFITSFIPHAAVSARVYIAAPRVPQLIDTLSGCWRSTTGSISAGSQIARRPPSHPRHRGWDGAGDSGVSTPRELVVMSVEHA